MTIRVETLESGDAASIVLDERFDYESVVPFRNSYEGLRDTKHKTVFVDFRDTKYIDSSALGMLINAKSFFDKQHVNIKLTNTSESIKKIFSISRFDKKFEIS